MLGIFLDTETNGLNAQKHKVIEVAFKIVDLYSGECKDLFCSVLRPSSLEWKNSDPESLKINGFSWEEVCSGKERAEVADAIQHTFARNAIQRGSAVFICQNPSFDRVFFSQLIDTDVQEKLLWPYHWLDLASMFFAEGMQRARRQEGPFPWESGLSKDKIAKALDLPPEGKPHRAMNGVNHLLLCYESIVGFGCQSLQ